MTGRSGAPPTLRVERELLRAGPAALGAMDEVGRGALAGPLAVGLVVIDAQVGPAPRGVRDSKLLTPAAREELAPRIRRWARAWAVGVAGPDEVDALGLTAALRRAGERALDQVSLPPELVLLDGAHDWLTRPPRQGDLFDDDPEEPRGRAPGVVTRVKADLTCAAVAAASVLAKVHRDALMVELSAQHPQYGWDVNKGYASPEHLQALRDLGPCHRHRRTWNLPASGAGADV